MIRGTTPTIQIELPQEFNIVACYITIRQKKENVIEKTLNNGITIKGKTIETTLTQEDTLKLKEGDIGIQLRFKTADGRAIASEINECVEVEQVLKDGAI